MNPADILKSILRGNATQSRRIDDLNNRDNDSEDVAGMARALEDMLGVGKGGKGRTPVERPLPRGSSPAPEPTRVPTSVPRQRKGLDDVLGEWLGKRSTPQAEPVPDLPQREPTSRLDIPTQKSQRRQEDSAVLLIRAMCNAAKVDGTLEREEQEAILGRLGEVSQQELDFVRAELAAPLDIDAFCESIPKELAPQIYGFSIMAINLDTMREAAYLGRLAQGLGLDSETCNQLHRQVQAPEIFAV